jgi:hypothetical protein
MDNISKLDCRNNLKISFYFWMDMEKYHCYKNITQKANIGRKIWTITKISNKNPIDDIIKHYIYEFKKHTRLLYKYANVYFHNLYYIMKIYINDNKIIEITFYSDECSMYVHYRRKHIMIYNIDYQKLNEEIKKFNETYVYRTHIDLIIENPIKYKNNIIKKSIFEKEIDGIYVPKIAIPTETREFKKYLKNIKMIKTKFYKDISDIILQYYN